MSRVCIKGLGPHTNEENLRVHFSSKGEITDCKIIKTKTGNSRKFGFIGYRTEQQAQEAVEYFNNTYVGTSKVSVNIAIKVGDENIMKKSQSKLTQSKIKKMNKINEELKIQQDISELKAKVERNKANSRSTPAELLMSKKKLDFLEVMKSRRNSKYWANDESMPSSVDRNDRNVLPFEPYTDTHMEITTSRNSSNLMDVDSEYASDDNNEDDDEVVVPIVDEKLDENLSDMEYLRRKMTNKVSTEKNTNLKNTSLHVSDHTHEKRSIKEGVVEPPAEQVIELEEVDEDRLFIRNLPYLCSEDELRSLFTTYGQITSVHIPLSEDKHCKGIGFVSFLLPESAEKARTSVDGTAFQGRVLHVIQAKKTPEIVAPIVNTKSKLSTYQQQKEAERKKLLLTTQNWNTSFIRSDTVIDSLAETYGLNRSEILDTTESGGELAVRLAMGETHIIQANKEYFIKNNINLNILECMNNNNKKDELRSNTTILIKNLPYNLNEAELYDIFHKYGNITSFLIPPSKTIALIDYMEPSEARIAFRTLSYRKYKHIPLYLEWAPIGLIVSKNSTKNDTKIPINIPINIPLNIPINVDDDGEYSSIFIKNLNFTTTEESLTNHINNLGLKGLRIVSIPKKIKGDIILSMGYGFAEFMSDVYANIACNKLNNSIVHGHSLEVKPSNKRVSVSTSISSNSINNNNNNNKKKRELSSEICEKNTKIIVRNVAFQATTDEIKNLFSVFGTVKRVRIPKKLGNIHRGFAFVEFTSANEANIAMKSLINTHLYGRHLILEWAKEENDAEDEVIMNSLRKKAKTQIGILHKQQSMHNSGGDIDAIIESSNAVKVMEGDDD